MDLLSISFIYLGSGGQNVHTFRNKCCPEVDFKIVISHTPCAAGCLECQDSKIWILSTTVGDVPVKSIGEGWRVST